MKISKFIWLLFLLMAWTISFAQSTDIEESTAEDEEVSEDVEVSEDTEYNEDDHIFWDPVTDEEESYRANHDAPEPWKSKEKDSYLDENLTPQKGGQKTWEKNRRKLKFEQDKPKAKKKPKKKNKKDKLNDFSGEGLGELLRWGIIVLGIGAIIGLLVYLVQGGSFRQGQKIHVDISDEKLNWIEENLPEADVQSPLEAAIISKEYRKAIRLYFLLIVQKMTLTGEINWQKEKTNRTYILETYNKDFHASFRSCVRIYERVWYGERSVNEDEFLKIEPIFKDLANRFIIPSNTANEG